jgi:uncharacterized paraquat-inducible protein A
MDQQLLLVALLGACAVAFLSLLVRIRREQDERDDATRESPIAMSSEGVKLCPSCATENMWTDTRCLRCGRHLPDAQTPAW